MNANSPVQVVTEDLIIPTYLPAPPNIHPMFFEDRVYQGSNGAVYPLPFTDRIAAAKTDRAWKAVRLENEFLRVLVLPELGGRVHAIQDKTNGYDLVSWRRLGRETTARKLLRDLLAYARRLAQGPSGIGFFATSLPTDVLRDDLAARRRTTALCLEAAAQLGLGERSRARTLLRSVLGRDPSHAGGMDLLRSSETAF